MHVVLLGPQGSGKGTQAKLLAKQYKLAHIETGAVFRYFAAQHNTLGRKINRLINVEGKLIPDKMVIQVIAGAMQKVPRKQGIVFDGYPRTLAQARTFDGLLKKAGRELTHVIYIPLRQSTTIRRLSLRRICLKCRTPWISGVTIPRRAVICPQCGGKVIQRKDDTPPVIKKRLREYLKKTKPILSYYKHRGIVMTVDGEPSIGTVWRSIKKHLHDRH